MIGEGQRRYFVTFVLETYNLVIDVFFIVMLNQLGSYLNVGFFILFKMMYNFVKYYFRIRVYLVNSIFLIRYFDIFFKIREEEMKQFDLFCV